jgi:hypothetical protein
MDADGNDVLVGFLAGMCTVTVCGRGLGCRSFCLNQDIVSICIHTLTLAILDTAWAKVNQREVARNPQAKPNRTATSIK